MPFFHTSERQIGLRFPMGARGRHQVSLSVVGVEGSGISKTKWSDPESIPKTSWDELQELMIRNQKIIRDAMDRKLAELEGRSPPEAASNVEVSIT